MNPKLIDSVSRQITQSSDKISQLAQEMPVTDEEINTLYTNMMMDELEHIQILTLTLTGMISGEEEQSEVGEKT